MKLWTLIFLFVLVSTLFPGVETRKIKKRGTEEKKDSASPKKDSASPKKDSVEPNKQDAEPKKEEKKSKMQALGRKLNLSLKVNKTSNKDDSEPKKQSENIESPENFLKSKEFENIEILASGNFGTVWKVEDGQGHPMAVKQVKTLINNVMPEEENNMLDAVKGARHITELKHFWKQGNEEYYVFDFYPDTLKSYPHFKKNEKESIEWKKTLKQILEGLADIHQRGVMHLDIKPENIMVKGEDVFIGDFGISKKIDSDKKTNQGTVLYKAPEQGIGKPETKSDIWAVGNLLLWFCTEKTFNSKLLNEHSSSGLIFEFEDLLKNPKGAESILKEMLDSIKEQLKELNIEEKDFDLLSKLLWQMMTVDPEQRPSAEDLLKQL